MMQGTGKSKSIGSGIGSTAAVSAGGNNNNNNINNGNMNMKKMKVGLPSPKEMVAHYESKGMQPQEASLKVIQDLQDLLLKVVVTNNKNNNNNNKKAGDVTIRRLESKLDSKPGYPQTLAIGIVSGAIFHVIPQVAASVANIWNSATSSSAPS